MHVFDKLYSGRTKGRMWDAGRSLLRSGLIPPSTISNPVQLPVLRPDKWRKLAKECKYQNVRHDSPLRK